jgi:hypothetical protein
VSSHGGSTTGDDYTTGSPSEPQRNTGYGVATRVTMMLVVTTPLRITPSLAFEPESPPLLGTLTGMLH